MIIKTSRYQRFKYWYIKYQQTFGFDVSKSKPTQRVSFDSTAVGPWHGAESAFSDVPFHGVSRFPLCRFTESGHQLAAQLAA
jgi:hypothetical protein